MQWNTIPTTLQRELFDTAGSLGDVPQTVALRGQIARFLHNHKDEEKPADSIAKPNRRKESLMAHKFNIGQMVEIEPGMFRLSAHGPYEIRHLVPASDRDPNNPCYRIKSVAEKHERSRARERTHPLERQSSLRSDSCAVSDFGLSCSSSTDDVEGRAGIGRARTPACWSYGDRAQNPSQNGLSLPSAGEPRGPPPDASPARKSRPSPDVAHFGDHAGPGH